MVQQINTPVSVRLSYNHVSNKVAPHMILWKNNTYPVTKLGLHHSFYEGKTLFHIFSVTTPNLFMRLKLNTQNLHWMLEEISDGLPD